MLVANVSLEPVFKEYKLKVVESSAKQTIRAQNSSKQGNDINLSLKLSMKFKKSHLR